MSAGGVEQQVEAQSGPHSGPEVGTEAAAATARGSSGGRAFLVTVDQALSSGSNLLAILWAAHLASPVQFGSFSLLMLIYTFVLGLVHALISMRIVVHPRDADERPRAPIGSAVTIALGWGALFAAIGAVQAATGVGIGPSLLALGLLLPLLTLHDVGRWVGVARSQPARAVLLDGTWLVLLVGSFAALEVSGRDGLLPLTVAWAGSGAVASLLVLLQYGVLRLREVSLAWLREHWNQSWRLLVGNLTASGSALVAAALMALVATPLAVAAVRGAILLGRPTSAIQLAVSSSVAADIAREQPDRRTLMRHQRRALLISAAVALVNLVVLVVLPDAVGELVLGNVWPVLADLVLPISLWLVVAAAQAGVPPTLIGRHQFQIAMVVQVVSGLLNLVALVVGAIVGGASGAVWGLVVGQAVIAACWWFGLYWHLGSHRRYVPTHRA